MTATEGAATTDQEVATPAAAAVEDATQAAEPTEKTAETSAEASRSNNSSSNQSRGKACFELVLLQHWHRPRLTPMAFLRATRRRLMKVVSC